jgi:transcriptional regulator with XRE-family HTH domain
MPPDFREQLQSAAGQLTAAQIAEATGASKRTVESWRQGRRKPKAREQAALLTRIKHNVTQCRHLTHKLSQPETTPRKTDSPSEKCGT